MEPVFFDLRGEHITLDALLKACGIAASGGDAKTLIASGAVIVNDQVETRRGRKLRGGDTIRTGSHHIRISAQSVA
jgi:ribosome-associated protein